MNENSPHYVFIGNRIPVLHAMRRHGLSLAAVCVMENSYAHAYARLYDIPCLTITGKNMLVDLLRDLPFDYLIANGCPYILPMTELQTHGKHFINLHPALLPNMRGRNPINGALLFSKPFGVTCHYMTDAVDDGPLIAQVALPAYTHLSTETLYSIHFLAEVEVFTRALQRNFSPDPDLEKAAAERKVSYYTRRAEDLLFTLDMSYPEIEKKIKAFGVPSQGAHFFYRGKMRKVLWCNSLDDDFALSVARHGQHGDIVFSSASQILFVFYGRLVSFERMENEDGEFPIGSNLLT